MRIDFKPTDKRIGTTFPIPAYKTDGAAAMDLIACIDREVIINVGERKFIGTGISMEIPSGCVGLLFARSNLGCNYGITPANCVGIIDSDYRGEIKVCLENRGGGRFAVNPGDRIAQLMVVKFISAELVQSDSLSESARGDGGFGSTGISLDDDMKKWMTESVEYEG